MSKKREKSSLIHGIRKVKLQTRLLVTCLVMSLVPVLFIGLYAYNVYTRSINDKLGQASEQAVKLLNITLMTELDKFISYINSLSVSDTVQSVLSIPPSESAAPKDGSETRAIRRLVDATPIQSKYLKNIRVLDREGRVIYDLGYDVIPSEQLASILDSVNHASPKDSMQYIKSYRSVDYIVLGRKIFPFAKSDEHIGYILIFIDEKLLSEKVFADVTFGPASNILLLDGLGSVLSSKNQALLGTSLATPNGLYDRMLDARQRQRTTFNAKLDDIGHLVIFNYNPEFDAYFVATIPESNITDETRQITYNLLLTAVFMIVLCLAATFIIYVSITQPIRKMTAFCHEAADVKLERKINDQSPDELGFLARTIDQNLLDLKNLAYQWQSDQRRKRELELETLQYQINPHFLFNTLNTLKWVAVLNDVPVLSEGISSLSSLLESTLMRKDEAISIRAELDNLLHYFSIQKIRYADCFDVSYDLDESLLDYQVPRFILQPIAENAIIHGTKDNGTSITIAIRCHRLPGGDIALDICDNGHGFNIADIQDQKREKFSGIGISNVHERLQLYYGKEYGLHITSTIGVGTDCRITLPAIANEKRTLADV